MDHGDTARIGVNGVVEVLVEHLERLIDARSTQIEA